MSKKKIISLVASLSLVAALGVGGTFALLSAQSNTVKNTFVVGTGLSEENIKLDETDVDDSTPNADRDTENEYVGIEPNTVLVKDPKVSISGEHAKCYLFVSVSGVDAMNAIDDVMVKDFTKKLKKIDSVNGKDGLYVYALGEDEATIVEEDASLELLVFDGIELGVNADIYKADGTGKELSPITVKACVVQCAGTTNTFENAKAALPNDFK